MHKYRRIAEDCLRLALKAKEQRHRQVFLDFASMLLERAGNDAKIAMLRAEVEALQRPAN
jgi:outer membrane protein TolC